MDEFTIHKDKVFESEQKSKSTKVIATVTGCLCSHAQCSGRYTDTITGIYVVECVCVCHSLEGEGK